MKVCLLYPHFFGHDGYVRDINTLHVELSRSAKHQIFVCPPSAATGIDGRPGIDELKLIKPLMEILPEVDLVHIFGFFFPLYPLLITLIQMYNKPYILSPLSQLEKLALKVSHSKKCIFLNTFGRHMLKKAAVIHAFSSSEAQSIKAITEKAPVMQASLGIYYEDIPPVIRPSRLRPMNDYFLFFGRLAYFHKGVDVLLDGYARYLARGGNTDLVIAGKSWAGSHEQIRLRIDELKLSSRLHFLGETSLDEKFSLIQECKAFIYPSRYDGPPRPVRDALALHKPLLVSFQANIISNIERYGWGYAFNPVPEELSDAMRRMDMEYNGDNYQDPQTTLSWGAVAAQYDGIYDSLAIYGPPACLLDDYALKI